jgi:hemolysin III
MSRTIEVLAVHYPNRAEEVADGVIHGLAIAAAIAGGGALLFWSATSRAAPGLEVATGLYALCLIVMLGCSAAYNLSRSQRARPFLRRLDEAGIFLMIAGSYTPFTTQRFGGGWAVGMTALVWAVALAGVAGKVLAPRLPDKLWTAVYLAFGWLVLIALQPLIQGVTLTALVLLVAGGLIYTSGILIFHSEQLPFRRAIWHGFVVAAAGAHYAAIFTGVVLAAPLGAG